jgi:cell division protein FtsQ
MKRSIVFWLYFVIAIILGVYFATRMIMSGLGHGKLATIHNISITADTTDAELGAIQTVAAAGLGAKTNSLDIVSLNRRIDDVPTVQYSATRRMPNGTLRIRVKLHHAVAQWTDGIAFYPLASDGTIVQTPNDTRDPTAIVFRGTLPTNVSDITSAAQPLISHIDYMEWIENRRWNIVTNDGITVMLPENNPIAAIRSLNSLNEKQNIVVYAQGFKIYKNEKKTDNYKNFYCNIEAWINVPEQIVLIL